MELTWDIDFLPEGVRHARARHRQAAVRAMLVAGVVLVLLAGRLLVGRRASHLEGQVAYARSKVEGLQEKLEQLALLSQRERQLGAKAAVIARLLRQPLSSRALGELVNTMPPRVVLLSCSLRPAPPRPAGAPPAEESPLPQMIVEGGAPSNLELADLIARLANTGRFEEIEFIYSRSLERAGEDLKRFEIRFRVRT